MAEQAVPVVILVLVGYLLQTALAQVAQEAGGEEGDILSILVEHLKEPGEGGVLVYLVRVLQELVGALMEEVEGEVQVGQMEDHHHPEPAGMAVITEAKVVGTFQLALHVLIMVFLVEVQFVLSGPVLHVHFLQLVQGICNGTIYSNTGWSAVWSSNT
jgi:hypothetical protein